MIIISGVYRKFTVSPIKLQILLFVIFVICFDLFVFRNILFISGFQSSDIDVGWIGLHGAQELFYPWNFENLGGASFPAGDFFISTYSSIAFGPAMAQKLTYYTSIPVASLSALLFLRRIKIDAGFSFLLSFVYQLNPWFVDEFMTGEPAMTWLFALLPLAAYFIYNSFKEPKELSNYFGLAIILAVSEMFTLQSLIVYAFLLSPFLLSLLLSRNLSRRWLSLSGIFLSIVLSLLANFYSLGSYLSAASGLVNASSNSLNSLFGGFSSLPAQSLKPWIILLFAGSILITILVLKKSRRFERVFLFSTIAFQGFFLAVYFAIPSQWVALIYLKFPLFTPFQNYDKFLLMPTVYLFSIIIFIIRGNVLQTSSNKSSRMISTPFSLYRHKLSVKPILKYASIIFVLLVLMASFTAASIQPAGSHINGDYYLHGEFSFPHNQIPKQYYELRSYLLEHGENFSLSSHVLVVPQNPGDILPFFVGETIIPGFIGPTQYLYNVIQNIAQNQSLGSYLMSLLGIKYVAIMGDPGDSGWPGSGGQVSEGGWGGGYFPQGNVTYYTHIMESWPSMKLAYRSDNLTILKNANYVGDAYFFAQVHDPFSGDVFKNLTVSELVSNISSGNYFQIYNNIETGSSVVSNPDLQHYTDWNFYAYNRNATFLSNGTVKLVNGSKGASLLQNVILQPNTTYEISLSVETHPSYSGFPPNGYIRNFVGIYWNQYTGYYGTPGASVDGYFNGNITGNRTFIFVTPQHAGKINAQIRLNYEPPLGNYTMYTSYSNVSMHPINGSVIFNDIVKPVHLVEENSAKYEVINTSFATKGHIVLDTFYSPEWVAVSSNGSVLHSSAGPLGLLEFNLTTGAHIKYIYYGGGTTYFDELLVGWITVGAMSVFFIASIELQFWHRRQRDKKLR